MSESVAPRGQRVDKWLFFARVVKSRSLAQKLVQAGSVRVNRDKIDNPARNVRPGDVLTISLRGGIRVLKIVAPGERRGPAPEAATLYEDLSAPAEGTSGQAVDEGDAPGRGGDVPGFQPADRPPTKKERRAIERMKQGG